LLKTGSWSIFLTNETPEQPEQFDTSALSRAGIIGFGVAVLGIIAFIVLYIVLTNLEVDPVPRLMISLCTPPALIAGAMGIYILISQRRSKN
jgi:hypothetical protein